jgi:WD40-like Beta Propeller Repeat
MRVGDRGLQLTNNAANDYGPVYSPNGKKIAAWDEKGNSSTRSASAGEVSLKSQKAPALPAHPTVRNSPNGRKIVYVRRGELNSHIYSIHVGGGGKSKVTDAKGLDSNPSWGAVRSGFPSGRIQQPTSRRGSGSLAASALSLALIHRSAWNRILGSSYPACCITPPLHAP